MADGPQEHFTFFCELTRHGKSWTTAVSGGHDVLDNPWPNLHEGQIYSIIVTVRVGAHINNENVTASQPVKSLYSNNP